jgi:hypothetical protein
MSDSTMLSGLVASVLITLGVVSVVNPAILGYRVQCIVRLVKLPKGTPPKSNSRSSRGKVFSRNRPECAYNERVGLGLGYLPS